MFNIHDEVLTLIAEDQGSEQHTNSVPPKESLDSSKTEDAIQEILNYAKKQFFKIVDNRFKKGVLWIYHDSDNDIHAILFQRLGMRYKSGRG